MKGDNIVIETDHARAGRAHRLGVRPLTEYDSINADNHT